MMIGVNRQNELEVLVRKGKSCFFAAKHMRTPGFSRDFLPKPVGAFLARLFGGRLWDLYLDALTYDKKILLGGDDPLGRFECLDVPQGNLLFVKLKYLAAYQFDEGGKFRRILRLFCPVNWLTGTVLGVCVQGPAWVVFYGNDIAKREIEPDQGIFSDQIIALDAKADFRLESLNPDGKSVFAQSMNALSTTVSIKFQKPTEVIYSTIRNEKLSKLAGVPRFLLGTLVVSFFIEWAIKVFFELQ